MGCQGSQKACIQPRGIPIEIGHAHNCILGAVAAIQYNIPPKAYAILNVITERVKAPAVATALAL